jgi:hypothetical protein
MAKKVKQKRTQVPKENQTKNLIGLVEYLLNIDEKLLNPINVTSLSDSNGGRIYY